MVWLSCFAHIMFLWSSLIAVFAGYEGRLRMLFTTVGTMAVLVGAASVVCLVVYFTSDHRQCS